MKTKHTNWTSGLDQLGPRHVVMPTGLRPFPQPREMSLNQRAELSRRQRRVKITLPSLSTLSKLMEG